MTNTLLILILFGLYFLTLMQVRQASRQAAHQKRVENLLTEIRDAFWEQA